MGRVVRRVPANWEHPVLEDGSYRELFPFHHYKLNLEEFSTMEKTEGLQAAIDDMGRTIELEDYMPNFPIEEKTYFMMYEDTTPGTPISPAFKTPEELAKYLVDNNVPILANYEASYETWLKIANEPEDKMEESSLQTHPR